MDEIGPTTALLEGVSLITDEIGPIKALLEGAWLTTDETGPVNTLLEEIGLVIGKINALLEGVELIAALGESTDEVSITLTDELDEEAILTLDTLRLISL